MSLSIAYPRVGDIVLETCQISDDQALGKHIIIGAKNTFGDNWVYTLHTIWASSHKWNSGLKPGDTWTIRRSNMVRKRTLWSLFWRAENGV